MRYIKIQGGPAGEAMEKIVSCLNNLTSLLESEGEEEADLENAPDDIKELVKKAITINKKLLAEVNSFVGKNLFEETEKPKRPPQKEPQKEE